MLEQAIAALAAEFKRYNDRNAITGTAEATPVADADPAPAAVKKAVAKAAPKAAAEKPAPVAEKAVEYKQSDVMATAIQLVATPGGRDKLNAILADYGVPKVSALPQEDLNKAAPRIKAALDSASEEV